MNKTRFKPQKLTLRTRVVIMGWVSEILKFVIVIGVPIAGYLLFDIAGMIFAIWIVAIGIYQLHEYNN